jgi:hypothetical protein
VVVLVVLVVRRRRRWWRVVGVVVRGRGLVVVIAAAAAGGGATHGLRIRRAGTRRGFGLYRRSWGTKIAGGGTSRRSIVEE